MKTLKWTFNRQSGNAVMILLSFCLTLLSCDTSNDAAPAATDAEETEVAQTDAQEDFYFEEMDALAVESIDDENNAGKIASGSRLNGATIVRTGDDSEGTITIDFGTGVTDELNRTRKGIVIISYRGGRRQIGSSRTITLSDFSINGVKLTGTRTVSISAVAEDEITYDIILEDGAALWPDGSIARRRAHHRREVHTEGNNLLDRLIVYGTVEGNHRNGRGFYIEIIEPLIYRRACSATGVIIPIQGIKLIKFGLREITINYGDGTCDNAVTITNKNGRSWDYRVN